MRPSHNLEDAKLYRKLFQTKKGVILYGTEMRVGKPARN